MSTPNLILIGAGGHTHACIDVIEQQGQFRIAGLVGTSEEVHSEHFGYSVIGTDRDLPKFAKKYQYALITIGQIHSPEIRIRLYVLIKELGFRLPIIVSPTAQVSEHATIGSGTIVMHSAIVNAGVKVGCNCIINTRALLEHDVTVEDHCHISTGAIVNGGVHIETGSFVGSGSIIKEGLKLGKSCVVGMSASVRHNLPDYARFVDNNKT